MPAVKNLLLIVLILMASGAIAKTTLYEDFDDNDWDTNFNASFCNFTYSCVNVASPSSKAGLSMKSTLVRANCTGARETEGDEIISPDTGCLSDCDFWSGFRIYFNSETFATDTEHRMIIYQYHGRPDDGGEEWRSPPYALTYETNGDVAITALACLDAFQASNTCDADNDGSWGNTYNDYDYMTGTALDKYVEIFTPVMDQWNDIVVHGHTSYTSESGSLEVWHNGVSVYSSSGHYLGYNDTDNSGYHKYGHYNWNCDTLMSDPVRESFIDDIGICTGADCVYSDVMPVGGTIPAGEQ